MNHFLDLGFPIVPTPKAPQKTIAACYDKDLGSRMDLSGGIHFAFETTGFKFAPSEFIKNAKEEDYVVVKITMGDSLVKVFSPFPLDEDGQYIMSEKTAKDLSTSKDREAQICANRNVLLESFDGWAQKMSGIFNTIPKTDPSIAKLFIHMMSKKPIVEKNVSYRYVNASDATELGWMPRFSTSMAEPIVQGLDLGQTIRKSHLQYWMEKTLVYLDAMQKSDRLGPVTVSLDNHPVVDWSQIANMRTECNVTKVAEKEAQFFAAIDAVNLHKQKPCKKGTYQVFTTEAKNFTVGITALSTQALQNDAYAENKNWKTLPHALESFGVSGLYLGQEKPTPKLERLLEDKAFDQLSSSAVRYVNLNDMHVAMHCGDFGVSKIQVLEDNAGEIVGVRSLIWPDAFDHDKTVQSIRNMQTLNATSDLSR